MNNKKGILNSREKIQKLDKSNVLGSIEALPKQIKHAWEETQELEFPKNFHKNIQDIIVVGMGGSALGGHIIKSLYKNKLDFPFEIINHYQLPKYADQNTLVILSSYSGKTEEVLEAAKQAETKDCKIVVISSGSTLMELALEKNYPYYEIDLVYNPSNQPRMAIGYAIFGLLGIFKKLKIISIKDKTIKVLVKRLEKTSKNLNPENKKGNSAKHLAYLLFRRIVALISSEHLQGAVHVFNNQLNENSKNLTFELQLPEMNHHYLEALSHPPQTKDDVIFLFFNSTLYHQKVQARFPLTQHIIKEKGYPTEIVQATAPTRFEQVFEIVQLGAYTNFYLALLNQENPAPIPTVDFFKKELKKLSQ